MRTLPSLRIQHQYGESLFVPPIRAAVINGALRPTIVWGDAIPTLIPEVETLIVAREELAPRTMFGFWRRRLDYSIVTQDRIDGILSGFTDEGYPLRVRIPNYSDPPETIRSFVAELPRFVGELRMVSMDQVLDQNLLRQQR